MNKRSRTATVALTLITIANIALHLFNISYPDEPVFDEAYFATFAADYLKHQAHFDIHPPFGKLIYALALKFSAPPDGLNTQFIKLEKNPKTGNIDTLSAGLNYGQYPYVVLRLVGAAFGIVLPLTLFWFLISIGAGKIAALLSALFVTLDNAILLETRLILMNGMMLVFALLGLALYFHKKRFALAGGVLFGLALSVKLSAVVFLAPPVLNYFLIEATDKKPEEKHRLKIFALTGFITLFLLGLINIAVFRTADRLKVLEAFDAIPQEFKSISSLTLKAFLSERTMALGNYFAPQSVHNQNPWYFWPAMQIPTIYYAKTQKGLLLSGNPLIWYASTLAIILGLAVLPRYAKDFVLKKLYANRTFLLLLGSYIVTLTPFVGLVKRPTFLYHYFPSLLFAIGLLSWFIAKAVGVKDLKNLDAKKIFLFLVICILAAAGFLINVKTTYGL